MAKTCCQAAGPNTHPTVGPGQRVTPNHGPRPRSPPPAGHGHIHPQQARVLPCRGDVLWKTRVPGEVRQRCTHKLHGNAAITHMHTQICTDTHSAHTETAACSQTHSCLDTALTHPSTHIRVLTHPQARAHSRLCTFPVCMLRACTYSNTNTPMHIFQVDTYRKHAQTSYALSQMHTRVHTQNMQHISTHHQSVHTQAHALPGACTHKACPHSASGMRVYTPTPALQSAPPETLPARLLFSPSLVSHNPGRL